MSRMGCTSTCRRWVANPWPQTSLAVLIFVALGTIVCGCRKESVKPSTKPAAAKQDVPETAAVKQAKESSTPAVTDAASSTGNSAARSVAAANTPKQSAKNSGRAAVGAPQTAAGGQKQSPTQAYASAEDLQKKATNANQQGNMEAAYGFALNGWEAVRSHKDDPRCRKLAAQLLQDLEVYGERISADSGESSLGGKPLKYE